MKKSTNQLLSVLKTHQYRNLNIKVEDRGFLKKTSNPLPKNKTKQKKKQEKLTTSNTFRNFKQKSDTPVKILLRKSCNL